MLQNQTKITQESCQITGYARWQHLFFLCTGPPSAPEIQDAAPGTDKTLPFSWTAQSSRTNQISSFRVVITVAGVVKENFTVSNSSARDHILSNHQGEKEYEIVVCAVNQNSMACSEPFLVPAQPTNPPKVTTIKPSAIVDTQEPADLSPGLIAGIVVVVVVAVLFCCFFFILLFLCLYCTYGERAYYPGTCHSIL